MNSQQSSNINKNFYRVSAADFKEIPGAPLGYWINSKFRKIFRSNPLSDYFVTRLGMSTANNDRFLRLWHEVGLSSICFSCTSREDSVNSGNIWFPYQKGGVFRKWFGNHDHLVNWLNDGQEIRSFGKEEGRIRSHNYNLDFIFKKGITWSDVTSGTNAFRIMPEGFLFDGRGSSGFPIKNKNENILLAFLNSTIASSSIAILNPTIAVNVGEIAKLPFPNFDEDSQDSVESKVISIVNQHKTDWDSYETSWDFTTLPLLHSDYGYKLSGSYAQLRAQWQENTLEMQRLEEENNRIFIEAYGLEDELTPDVPLNEITLTCNPHYRYRLGKQWDDASEEERNAELERQLQSDTLCELISYAIGCMMGRYSIDQPGLILASQGETLQDYLERVPNPRFLPDDDAIVPLTDQEWFADDATHRVREFVRTVWGEQHLQENLDFIAESLCLSAIRPRKGESSLDCIRRYLSTQCYKDHMRTYKKRPIYWLFSSGKLKAFECLVYLHRYTEGTLARMRTEYVIPLTARLHSHGERLEEARANSTSAAETKRLEKELDQLHKQQAELAEFDEQLRHYADQRIRLDLDDGVKVNYGKFGNLLADVKAIAG